MKNNQDDDTVIISDEYKNTVLEKQRVDFINKFGREPGPSDPVYFDPNSDTPQVMSKSTMENMYYDSMLSSSSAFSNEDN